MVSLAKLKEMKFRRFDRMYFKIQKKKEVFVEKHNGVCVYRYTDGKEAR